MKSLVIDITDDVFPKVFQKGATFFDVDLGDKSKMNIVFLQIKMI